MSSLFARFVWTFQYSKDIPRVCDKRSDLVIDADISVQSIPPTLLAWDLWGMFNRPIKHLSLSGFDFKSLRPTWSAACGQLLNIFP